MTDDVVFHYVNAVVEELFSATKKHPRPLKSLHEAHSVIREEFDEFWDEVKRQHIVPVDVEMELIQVAAMALRALVELGPNNFESSN